MTIETRAPDDPLRTGILMGAGFAILWAILAVTRDGVTLHLAPIIVAATPAAVTRRVVAGTFAGAGLLAATTVALGAAGRLSGPSLLPWGAGLLETIVFGAIGVLGGALLATRPTR